ncbi:MAG: CHAD domain-containing protein [Comamonadaceae bacterium]|nr:CHAD domain-containing protein [Comamonadaceae bacterium]
MVAGRGRAAQRLPLLELELELKSGRPRALFKLAQQLMAGDSEALLLLLPFAESKAGRGYRLLAGKPQPVKAAAKEFAAPLRPELSADAALRKVIGGADVLLYGAFALAYRPTAFANAQGLAEHDDPEFVHQARVALRRMRSAVPAVAQAQPLPARLAAELQWIGRALGARVPMLMGETLPHLAAGLGTAHAQALHELAAAAQATHRRAPRRRRRWPAAALPGSRSTCWRGRTMNPRKGRKRWRKQPPRRTRYFGSRRASWRAPTASCVPRGSSWRCRPSGATRCASLPSARAALDLFATLAAGAADRRVHRAPGAVAGSAR